MFCAVVLRECVDFTVCDGCVCVVLVLVRSTHSYFTGISDVYRYYDLYAVEKFVEPFSNGVVVFGFQLG